MRRWPAPHQSACRTNRGVMTSYDGVMIAYEAPENMRRVSLTLDPIDVDLLDRLTALGGGNRSEQIRAVLVQVRPAFRSLLAAFEAVRDEKQAFDQVAASIAETGGLAELVDEAERLQLAFLGSTSRLEGLAAFTKKPPSSNTGVTPGTPPAPDRRK